MVVARPAPQAFNARCSCAALGLARCWARCPPRVWWLLSCWICWLSALVHLIGYCSAVTACRISNCALLFAHTWCLLSLSAALAQPCRCSESEFLMLNNELAWTAAQPSNLSIV